MKNIRSITMLLSTIGDDNLLTVIILWLWYDNKKIYCPVK